MEIQNTTNGYNWTHTNFRDPGDNFSSILDTEKNGLSESWNIHIYNFDAINSHLTTLTIFEDDLFTKSEAQKLLIEQNIS